MFALAIISVTFLMCKVFFTKTVETELEISFKSFLSSYESSVKLEKEKSSLNSIFDVFGSGVVMHLLFLCQVKFFLSDKKTF
jgi:hypothetical protein